jgi:hypothetical protein
VTGALFAGAVILINGKQRVTSFNQSIRNIQTELQQTANDVGSGYYDNNGKITCTSSGGNLVLGTGTAKQGTNMDCIFLGKIAQFGVGTTDPELYNVYTMIGLRGDASSQPIDLASAKARVIAKGPAEASSTIPDDQFQSKQLQYGLAVSSMYYDGNPSNSIGAFGFSSSMSSLGTSDASQRVDIVAVTGSALHVDKSAGVGQINANLTDSVINPPGGVQICFNSGGTDQSGLITIGGASRQGLVGLKIYTNPDCV